MTNTMFHNDTSAMNNLWFESHKNLVASVCVLLKKEKEIPQLVETLLGKKLKTKKLKDPNKPKRAKSSYLYYCDDKRDGVINKIKKGEKGVSISIISKELGSGWKQISDKDKEQYIKLANDDKERYIEEMENYTH